MVEIIPRPAQKLPLWQNILFYFSIALLVASFLSFFILERSLKDGGSSLKNLEETLTREKTPQESSLEKDILAWQKRVKNFSQLFSQHLYPSKSFDAIESIAHPEVWIKQVSLDSAEAKAVVSGETESFTTLGQQLLILEQESRVKSFTLASLAIGRRGKVDFTLNIFFNPAVFKR
ncbi:MAG: hypothetical protein HY443_02155 [Candidatus Nealsonbacteria bacterium]|nr:hypothetical protein [Candidatus Nealsonbacteria bacterium]